MPRPIKAESPRQSPLKAVKKHPLLLSHSQQRRFQSSMRNRTGMNCNNQQGSNTFYNSVLLPLAFHVFHKISFTFTGRIMMKGEINPSCNNIQMIRFIVADDFDAIQGVAFSNVAEALSTQLEGKVEWTIKCFY